MIAERSPLRGLFWLVAAAALGGLIAWQAKVRLDERPMAGPAGGEAAPRLVAARGDLAADEKATIELFERSKGSVVYIVTTERVRSPWSRNLADIPRGTGSGFVWDE